jgi:hypothetical protein
MLKKYGLSLPNRVLTNNNCGNVKTKRATPIIRPDSARRLFQAYVRPIWRPVLNGMPSHAASLA